MKFDDRTDAGQHLAQMLTRYQNARPLVLALPRGGVPVGYEVARALAAPLDVFVVRKLGAPFNPEFGIGALAEDGTVWVDEDTASFVGEEVLAAIVARERIETERRVQRYRGDRAPPDVRGRTVIVVDDGVATGGTARAAIHALRAQRPAWLVLAVPVAAPEVLNALRGEVDDVVCLYMPRYLDAVGRWYGDFHAVSDEEVARVLAQAHAEATDGFSSQPRG